MSETLGLLHFFYDSLFLKDEEISNKAAKTFNGGNKNMRVKIIPRKEHKSSDDFNPFRTDHEEVSKTRQDMFRHLQIYLPVISLIKDNIHIIEVSQHEKVVKLFRLCFAFLTAFVKDNDNNQKILSHHLVVFLYNMHWNLGHVKLLIEIFKDNAFLCKNKLDEVIPSFLNIISTTGRKAEYLEFFKIIQKVGDKVIYNNQKLVLNIFLNPAEKNTLLYLKPIKHAHTKASNKEGKKNDKDSRKRQLLALGPSEHDDKENFM